MCLEKDFPNEKFINVFQKSGLIITPAIEEGFRLALLALLLTIFLYDQGIGKSTITHISGVVGLLSSVINHLTRKIDMILTLDFAFIYHRF